MTPPAPALIRDTVLLLSARLSQVLAQVVVVVVLVRRLGLAGYGTLSIVLATAGLTRQLGELGLDLSLSRQVLPRLVCSEEIVPASLTARAVAVLGLTLPLGLAVEALAPGTLTIFALLQLDALLMLWAGVFFAHCRANGDARPEGTILTVSGIAFAVLVHAFVQDAVHFALVSLVCSVATLVLVVHRSRSLAAWPSVRPTFGACLAIVRCSMPVALAAAMGFLYARVGLAALYAFAGADAAGAFSVAQRVLLVASLLPASFATALLPGLSRAAAAGREAFAIAGRMPFSIALAIGFPVSLAFARLVPPVVGLGIGERAVPALPLISLLSLSLCASFPGTVLGFSMIAGASLASYCRFWAIALVAHGAAAMSVAWSGGGPREMALLLAGMDSVITLWLWRLVQAERGPLPGGAGLTRGVAAAAFLQAVLVCCPPDTAAGWLAGAVLATAVTGATALSLAPGRRITVKPVPSSDRDEVRRDSAPLAPTPPDP